LRAPAQTALFLPMGRENEPRLKKMP